MKHGLTSGKIVRVASAEGHKHLPYPEVALPAPDASPSAAAWAELRKHEPAQDQWLAIRAALDRLEAYERGERPLLGAAINVVRVSTVSVPHGWTEEQGQTLKRIVSELEALRERNLP